MQDGFLVEDDAGAHDAYERELDEEADIAAMEAEAAQRRAEGVAAAAANGGQAAASSSKGPAEPGDVLR
jgi:hypothetical protein